MADQVLYSGVASVTDLMVKEGLINLDFADVRSIMRGMGKAMMGTGEATGERRANLAAEAAIANPLLDEVSMKGARGLLISITGGHDLTLYEVDEAASRIRQEVDEDANIILGATFDSSLEGVVRVSVVATGIDLASITVDDPTSRIALAEAAERLRAQLHQAARSQAAPAVLGRRSVRVIAESAGALPITPRRCGAARMASTSSRRRRVRPIGEPRCRRRAPPQSLAGAYVPPAPGAAACAAHAADRGFPEADPGSAASARATANSRRKSIFERLASFGASRQEDAIARRCRVRAAPARLRRRPALPHAEYGKRPAAPAPPQPGGPCRARPARPPRPAAAPVGGRSSGDPGLPASPGQPLNLLARSARPERLRQRRRRDLSAGLFFGGSPCNKL